MRAKVTKRSRAGQVQPLQQAGSFGIDRVHVGIHNIRYKRMNTHASRFSQKLSVAAST
jgi:hypothetical protein